MLVNGYWPFWFGGPAMGLLVVVMWIVEKRSLGVSGSISEVVRPEDAKHRDFRTRAEDDEKALEEAMMRATMDAFSEEELAALAAEEEVHEEQPPHSSAVRGPLPFRVHLTFLSMLMVGGAAATLSSGTWSIGTSLGAVHDTLTGGGVFSLLILVFGGILVGFGTRMSGGCTTGNGLSGCARMQPASLLATASFFGTAVGVSILLKVVFL